MTPNGGSTTSCWTATGYVWTPGGSVIGASPQLSFCDIPGGTSPTATFMINKSIPDGTKYYYGAQVEEITSGPATYIGFNHPSGGNHRIISEVGETDNSGGYSSGSWLPMFRSGDRISMQNVLLNFDTGNFTTQAGGPLGTSTRVPASYFAPFGAEYTTPQPLKADFSGIPRQGEATLAVDFTDQSLGDTPATSWLWNFGDGGPTSAVQHPSHDYTAAGVYTVTLTVNNGVDPEASVVKEAYIVVYDSSCGMTVEMAGKENGGGGTKKESPITLINEGYVCFEPHVNGAVPGSYKWESRKTGIGADFELFSNDEKPIKHFK